jgi:hypothetical protein
MAEIFVLEQGIGFKMMTPDKELEKLREQVQGMQEELRQMHEAIMDTCVRMQQRPAELSAPWYAPRRYARVFDWMYDCASIHATARDFEYVV